LWAKLGYPEFEVLTSDEASIRRLPFPEETEKIGLAAGDPLSEAGRKALRFQFARMLGQEAGTRLGDDIEALHHMRVATRRLRAAFEVFDVAFESGELKPYRRGLRQAGRALGKVRDLDVLMDKARKYIAGLPEDRRQGLDPLLEYWTAQRAAAREEMLAYLDGKDYADFKRQFNIFLNTPGAGARPVPPGQPVPHTVRDLAPALIYERLAAVRAYAPLLADAPVETLHALRIEFKKLRYTVEYFQEALGKRSKIVLDLCKQLQDHLGDLNDAEVAAHLLHQFIDEWDAGQNALPIHERRHIGEVVNYLAYNHAERHRLMSTFQNVWHKRFEHSAFRRSLAQAVSVL
jgi:CHAD domain-containing protein